MELEYKDFNPSQKRGIHKYSSLSTKGMKAYKDKYEKKTGKSASNINNKGHFFAWVDRNKIRK